VAIERNGLSKNGKLPAGTVDEKVLEGGSARGMGGGDKSIALHWKNGNLVSLGNNDKNATAHSVIASQYFRSYVFKIGQSRLL
jgi:hypothetical protein